MHSFLSRLKRRVRQTNWNGGSIYFVETRITTHWMMNFVGSIYFVETRVTIHWMMNFVSVSLLILYLLLPRWDARSPKIYYLREKLGTHFRLTTSNYLFIIVLNLVKLVLFFRFNSSFLQYPCTCYRIFDIGSITACIFYVLKQFHTSMFIAESRREDRKASVGSMDDLFGGNYVVWVLF